MSVPTSLFPVKKLVRAGLRIPGGIHYQLPADELVKLCINRGEGVLNDSGALIIETGEFTGRSPKDKFIVTDSISNKEVHWNEFNQPIDEKYFRIIQQKITSYLNSLTELWVRDCYACADPRFRLSIRVISETAAGSLFAHNMFIRPSEQDLENFKPEWQLMFCPGLKLNAAECGTRQHNAVVVSFAHKTILIAGTGYTGEIKKSIFSILNFLLPIENNVLPMHCSANTGKAGDTAIFFGLSGTGKTTLSTDPQRKLIGDDEHGWSDTNVFNFEGGCYAKCINLCEANEPEIFHAIKQGALVENIKFIPGTKTINFQDGSITENTRVSYPLNHIRNIAVPSVGNTPKHIFFLTCDAYGVLPPVSRLSTAQAMYQFILGYTAKIAGTETGITEPKSTFSACFGAPFLPLHPGRYAEMLGERMKSSNAKVWLINTGWTGGQFGTGTRIKLAFTRAMINAVLEGKLDKVKYETLPVFNLQYPSSCPLVPADMLNPAKTWKSPEAYQEKAKFLANLFIQNFKKYADGVSGEVMAAGPGI